MTHEELLKALPEMAPIPGSFFCQGCGYEHNCSLHGCAIIRAAMEEILQLAAENGAMQAKLSPEDATACRRPMSSAERDAILEWPPSTPPNPPLTLDELRKMDGEPVFVTVGEGAPIELGFWVLVDICGDTGRVWLTNNLGVRCGYDTNAELETDEIRAYRRKPEEGTT